jgi:glycosyltransferase involved in cell wall biosynthesis
MTDHRDHSGGDSARRLDDLEVALAHWHIDSWGGAEYLVTKLAEALGEATVYTVGTPEPPDPNPYGSVDFRDVTRGMSSPVGVPVRKRLGRAGEYGLWEDVDWRRYGDPDVLVTSGSTTRAVITPDSTLHVNYCHSPPRWLYDLYHDRKESRLGRLARPLLRYLRVRDAALDDRVDHYLANSPVVSRRLWKYYKREADVLYPPLELDRYENAGDGGFYLHLGRLDGEKGVEAVVEAFEELEADVVFAGGEGDADVRDGIRRAGNMEYVGFVSEQRKFELLSTCRAVVFNGRNEDFGIVPVEANASGKPCLVRDEGFPGSFVEDGSNGYLHDGTAPSIREAVSRLEDEPPDTDLPSHVSQFSRDTFERDLAELLTDAHRSFRTQFSV